MGPESQNIKIVTCNANGLLNPRKCGAILNWISALSPGIIFLQETHFRTNTPKIALPRMFQHAYFSSANLAVRGVGILLSNVYDWQVKEVRRDDKGRWLWVEAQVQGIVLDLVNYYGPIEDETEALGQIYQLAAQMKGILIMGGDFNFIQNLALDTSNKNKRQLKPKTAKLMSSLLLDYSLTDPWRYGHPSLAQFTCYSARYRSASRLDYFLVDKLVANGPAEIKANSFSDHSLVLFTLRLEIVLKRRARWQFDKSLLQDTTWITETRGFIKEFFQINIDTAPLFMVWEAFKSTLRGQIISYKARLSNQRKQKILDLQKAVEQATGNLCFMESSEILRKNQLEELARARENLKDFFLLEEIAGSKAYQQKVYEESQQIGRFLAWSTKRQRSAQTITKIKDFTGRVEDDNLAISEIFLNYFRQIYGETQVIPQGEVTIFFESIELPLLSYQLSETLKTQIRDLEIQSVLKSMPNAKASGGDGFPVELYKVFQEELIPFLVKLYNQIKEGVDIPKSFKESVLVIFLKKDKDPCDVSSYRPISLLNTDYKLLMKIWAKRIAPCAEQLVHKDQNGFISGRSMSANTYYLAQAIDYFSTNKLNAVIMMMDAEKAFDLVDWRALFYILGKFGFPSQFLQMLQEIYSQAEAKIIINGVEAGKINIKRGTRQGCPMSPLLFSLFIEPLAVRIRQSAKILPPIEGMTKIKLYADDIILYLKAGATNIQNALDEIHMFTQIGGYKINQAKTEILAFNVTPTDIPSSVQLKPSHPVRYLGILVTNDFGQLFPLNYNGMLKKVKKLLDKWSLLQLSLIGRISMIKMSILPLFLFLFVNLPLKIPKQYFKELDQMIRKFVWNNKHPRVRLATLQFDIASGGLALPHFSTYYQASIANLLSQLGEEESVYDKFLLIKMVRESATRLPVFLRQAKLPKKSRYKVILSLVERIQLFFKSRGIPAFQAYTQIEDVEAGGLVFSRSLLQARQELGFLRLGDFYNYETLVTWETVQMRSATLPIAFFFSFLQVVNFL